MSIRPPANSRFGITDPIVTADGIETFGLLKRFPFLDRANLASEDILNIPIDADLAGRPDQLAIKLYGTPDLQWVAILFNNIQNPFGFPKNGSVVEYPSPSVVLPQL